MMATNLPSCYKILETLSENPSNSVYQTTQDGNGYIVKVLAPGVSPLFGFQRLRKEYDICCKMASVSPKYFLKPSKFLNDNGQVGIVWEDVGLITLKVFSRVFVSIADFIMIAKQMVEALHILHSCGIIHRDISPKNILINPGTLQIFLSDFGSSSYWREFEENMIQTKTGYPSCGTYQYMSPEHTGKINHAIDHRSDIYSLGIVFYELLCGASPLSGISNRVGILFAHVALEFPPLHLLSSCHSRVPLVLSNIISKMLKKDIEKRYQSCLGIGHDLGISKEFFEVFSSSNEKLVSIASHFSSENNRDVDSLPNQLSQLQLIQGLQKAKQTKENLNFPVPLGTKDRTSVLKLQSKLYGRDKELRTILNLFCAAKNAKQPNTAVVVIGSSGSGKTLLIENAIEQIVHLDDVTGNYLLFKTKFAQYSAASLQCIMTIFLDMLHAVQEAFADDTMLKSEVKNHLTGEEIALLIDAVLPDLHRYFPDQSVPQNINSLMSVTKLRQAVCKWVSFVARNLDKQIIILYIDDIQWGDDNSIQMLKEIFNHTTTTIFFFFAARENESERSTTNFLVNSFSKNNTIRKIRLGPLKVSNVANIIANMTGSRTNEIIALAELTTRKTKGNPFFITEFITKLYTDELMRFNFDKQTWEYDLAAVELLNCTSNVVQLLIDEIRKLPIETKEILEIASCIGPQFHLDLLCSLVDIPREEVLLRISVAFASGFVQPKLKGSSADLSDGFIGSICTKSQSTIIFSFLHFRVHEGFYESLDPTKRAAYHYQIGLLLKKKLDSNYNGTNFQCRIGGSVKKKLETDDDSQEGEFYNVVYQLVKGQSLISNVSEALEFFDLFLEGAMLARKLGNYSHAFANVTDAKNLLFRWLDDEKRWNQEYKRTCLVLQATIIIKSICPKETFVDEEMSYALAHVTSLYDRLEFLLLHVSFLNNSEQYDKAIELGLKVFDEFLPNDEKAILDLSISLKDLEGLYCDLISIHNEEFKYVLNDLLPCEEETKLFDLILRFIHEVIPALFVTGNILLYSTLIYIGVKITLKYGLLPSSEMTIAAFGFVMNACFDISQESFNVAREGQIISRKQKLPDFNLGRSYLYTGMNPVFSYDFLRATESLEKSAHFALQAVDFVGFANAKLALVMSRIFFGTILSELVSSLETDIQIVQTKTKQRNSGCVLLLRAIYNAFYILIDSSNPNSKNEDTENIQTTIAPFFQFGISFYKLISDFFLKNDNISLRRIQQVETFSQEFPGYPISIESLFYCPLARLQLPNATNSKNELILLLEKNITRLLTFGKFQPYIQCRVYILQAEKLRLEGKELKVLGLLDKAYSLASKQGLYNIASIAIEQSLSFLKENEIKIGQKECQMKAENSYRKWGAVAICNTYIAPSIRRSTGISRSSSSMEQEISVHNLVLNHVTEILTNERSTSDSITIFCKIILQQAGADVGYIFYKLEGTEELYVLAEWNNHGTMKVHHLPNTSKRQGSIHSSTVSNRIPFSIVNKVLQTGETATELENISDTPNEFGSICCVPMRNRHSTVGAVYLENTLMKGAFPRRHQSLLEHLACQIVSIIERNELNRNLKKTVKKVQKRASMLEALNKMKDDFVAATSHELRTPLNAIIGFSEILSESELSQEQRECCEMVSVSAEGLLAVINDILDFQRCQQNSITVDASSFDLRKLLDHVLRLLIVKVKKVELLLDFDDNLPPEIWLVSDRMRLQQILLNLLSNAVKFTSKGFIVVRIYVEQNPEILSSFQDSDDGILNQSILYIAVEDTGIGIDESQYCNLFKPFSQLDSGPTRKYTGTGLGLTISQNFVRILSEEHSRIHFTSKPGVGTKFFFHLPITWALPELNDDQNQQLKRRNNSLRLLQDSLIIGIIESSGVRKFFSHEIRNVEYSAVHFIEKFVDCLPLLNSFSVPPANVLCFVDISFDYDEHEILCFVSSLPQYVYLFLLTPLKNRNQFHSILLHHKRVEVIAKPFYKDLIVNTSAATIQRMKNDDNLGKRNFTRNARRSIPAIDSMIQIVEEDGGAVVSAPPSVVPTRSVLILMVEDNKMNQKVQTRILQTMNIQCEIACNGVEGVRMFKEKMEKGESYPLILMDFHMPEMGGKEATLAIRALEIENSFPATHIIGLTADPDGDSTGMCNVIGKPIKKSSFSELIGEFLSATQCNCKGRNFHFSG